MCLYYGLRVCGQKYIIIICRATIDRESKIRTAEQNLILLPKMKTIVCVCTTNVGS